MPARIRLRPGRRTRAQAHAQDHWERLAFALGDAEDAIHQIRLGVIREAAAGGFSHHIQPDLLSAAREAAAGLQGGG